MISAAPSPPSKLEAIWAGVERIRRSRTSRISDLYSKATICESRAISISPYAVIEDHIL